MRGLDVSGECRRRRDRADRGPPATRPPGRRRALLGSRAIGAAHDSHSSPSGARPVCAVQVRAPLGHESCEPRPSRSTDRPAPAAGPSEAHQTTAPDRSEARAHVRATGVVSRRRLERRAQLHRGGSSGPARRRLQTVSHVVGVDSLAVALPHQARRDRPASRCSVQRSVGRVRPRASRAMVYDHALVSANGLWPPYVMSPSGARPPC